MAQPSVEQRRRTLTKFLRSMAAELETCPDADGRGLSETADDLLTEVALLAGAPDVTSRLNECLRTNALPWTGNPGDASRLVYAVVDALAIAAAPQWTGFGCSVEVSVISRQGNSTELQYASPEMPVSQREAVVSKNPVKAPSTDTPERFPLHAAVAEGDADGLSALLAKGLDVNGYGPDGTTPLHEAVFSCQEEIAELLILRGADVNARTKEYGDTPLHMAAKYENPDLVVLLMDSGAQIGLQDIDGATALHLAPKKAHSSVRELLKFYGCRE